MSKTKNTPGLSGGGSGYLHPRIMGGEVGGPARSYYHVSQPKRQLWVRGGGPWGDQPWETASNPLENVKQTSPTP